MTTPELVQALLDAGFTDGWVVQGDEIVLWENDAPQPTRKQLGLPALPKTAKETDDATDQPA